MKFDDIEGNSIKIFEIDLVLIAREGCLQTAGKHSVKHPHEVVPGDGTEFQRFIGHLHLLDLSSPRGEDVASFADTFSDSTLR